MLRDDLLMIYQNTLDYAGETVAYTPANTAVPAFGLTAFRASLRLAEAGEGGKRISGRLFQFVVLVTAYTAHNAQTPKAGDTVTDVDGHIYEVVAPPGGFCWEWGEPQRIGMKINVLEKM